MSSVLYREPELKVRLNATNVVVSDAGPGDRVRPILICGGDRVAVMSSPMSSRLSGRCGIHMSPFQVERLSVRRDRQSFSFLGQRLGVSQLMRNNHHR